MFDEERERENGERDGHGPGKVHMKEEQDINRGFAEQVIAALRASPEERAPEGTRIDVHAAVSRFAVLYERIRTAIDYKDEHLLRKAAILRILKRQLVLERDAEAVASNVIRELISAGYFPNNELPESLIRDVADPVSKYQSIERTRIGSPSHLAWLRRVIASEIEELLVDSRREKALVALLYERLVDRLRVTGAMKIDEIDLRLQIYLACHRAFLKSDEDTLSYKLLRAYLPEWLRPPEWVENSVAVAERLVGVERRIHASLRHPLGPRIQRAVKPWAVSFQLLVEALAEKPEEAAHLIDHPESLRAVVARLADRQYRVAKGKLRRGAFRAIIYIFVTKMLIAFALEVPIEKALYGETSVPTLAVNLLFPPVMMFIVALFIRIPGRENTERLQANAASLLSTAGVPSGLYLWRKKPSSRMTCWQKK